MDGIKGSLSVSNQPIDRLLLHDFDLPQNFLHFLAWTKLEMQANDIHAKSPSIYFVTKFPTT
jgi:hypothetical protein